ncbi:hypothetical protein CPC16_011929 [Podila verticillata]|nr:hypothetical protein CPC16_011929 [Podila verticillata]
MAFITYQFDSPAQFYAELKDVLEEGGFHADPEEQVNSYITLITQHQDEFLDNSGQDLAQCCYRLLDSDVFQQNTLAVTNSIIERAIQSPVDQDMWVTYHILLYAGKEFPKVYSWMLRSEFFAKLKYQILQQEGSSLQPLAVNLMYEMCRVQSLKPCDIALLDETFLHYLLDLVERTRTDADENLNYGSIKLLLTFNEQYMLNMSNRANYTPSGAKPTYSGNPLLTALTDRPGASCTFGENLIFILNRAEETALQMLILKLLYLLFTSPTLYEFFYTNDLHVLVDVVIRELWNLPEEEESLRHAYLRVMGPLLTNTQLKRATYKRAEIVRVLRELGGGDLDTTLRLQLQEQQMREQQLEQSRAASAKLTYRDRESSSSPAIRWANNSACPSPVLAANAVRHHNHRLPQSKMSTSSTSSLEVPAGMYPNGTRHTILDSLEVESTDFSIAVPPPVERRDSQPRAASPTTQRLVERVLREWLDNEMKNGAGTTGVGLSVRDVTDGHVSSDQRIEIPVAQ